MADENSTSGPYCICRSYDDSRFMICCDRCNQWFHGDCVRVKAEEAKKISNFYCPPCQKSNPTLRTVYGSTNIETDGSGVRRRAATPSFADSAKRSSSSANLSDSASKPAKISKTTPSTERGNCGNCIGCFRTDDCGRCDVCKGENRTVGRICRLRQCVNFDASGSIQKDADYEGYESSTKRKRASSNASACVGTSAKLKNVGAAKKRHSGKVGRPPKQGATSSSASSQKRLASKPTSPAASSGPTRSNARAYKSFLRDAGLLAHSDEEKSSKTMRHCHGPACVYAARPQSKYCSDECGTKLAEMRIKEYLPSRLQLWHSKPPVAEDFERRRLGRIGNDQDAARRRLSELDAQEKDLSAWVSSAKATDYKKCKQSDDTAEAESDDPEMNVYCVTCGNETSAKMALKHFAKCFSKYESQTSYGTPFKAVNNMYNLFCDAYNKANRTYCKRLRIICPEHSKDSKVDPHEICGAPTFCGPLGGETFDVARACTALKKNCTKHYKWEKIRRALIDMERLTQLLRLEELCEEKRIIQAAQTSRGNLMALLLHETVSHERRPEEKCEPSVEKMETSAAGAQAADEGTDEENDPETQEEHDLQSTIPAKPKLLLKVLCKQK